MSVRNKNKTKEVTPPLPPRLTQQEEDEEEEGVDPTNKQRQ